MRTGTARSIAAVGMVMRGVTGARRPQRGCGSGSCVGDFQQHIGVARAIERTPAGQIFAAQQIKARHRIFIQHFDIFSDYIFWQWKCGAACLGWIQRSGAAESGRCKRAAARAGPSVGNGDIR